MQVSVYLTGKIVKKIDRVAKRTGRSRSRVIESLLELSLQRLLLNRAGGRS